MNLIRSPLDSDFGVKVYWIHFWGKKYTFGQNLMKISTVATVHPQGEKPARNPLRLIFQVLEL